MANSQGTQRSVALSKETTFGTKPAKNTAKLLPRIETSLNVNFESFQSEEIRDDMQRAASIVGFEKVEGDVKGELAAGQWAWAFAAALRGAFGAEAKPPIIKKTANGQGEKNGKILVVPQTAHSTGLKILAYLASISAAVYQNYHWKLSRMALPLLPSPF